MLYKRTLSPPDSLALSLGLPEIAEKSLDFRGVGLLFRPEAVSAAVKILELGPKSPTFL